MTADRRRTPRPASSPARVEIDAESGKTTVDVDAVTPREMHAHLASVYEKVDDVDDKIADVRVDFEKRLGRIEKVLLLIAVMVASPKVGGPELPKITKAALEALSTAL